MSFWEIRETSANLFRVNYNAAAGIYDLRISNTSYDRDNGNFECRQVIYTYIFMYSIIGHYF